jgi:hypothetical protein
MLHSGLYRFYQGRDAQDIDGSPEIIGERGQAELGADFLQALNQEGTLVHPLLDRPERMLDGFASHVEDAGSGSKPLCHAIEHCLTLPPRDVPKACPVQWVLSGQSRQARRLL